jgi:N-acetylglutamate synthase-like GNAT family acetyltransferase
MCNAANIVIRTAVESDLVSINRVIADAVMGWPLPERLKRLTLSSMQYDAQDMRYFEMFVALIGERVAGVASWDPDHEASLFHGLYIEPESQNLGLGQYLMQHVFVRAKSRGRVSMLIRAERVSASYFTHQHFEEIEADATDYPYQFRKWL